MRLVFKPLSSEESNMAGYDSGYELAAKCRALPLEGEEKEEIEQLCKNLEAAVDKARSNECQPEDIKRLIGNWARLRQRYCKITGEALV